MIAAGLVLPSTVGAGPVSNTARLHVVDDLGRQTFFHRIQAKRIAYCAIERADVLFGREVELQFDKDRAADALDD